MSEVKMKVISHVWGLCDEHSNVVPHNVPFDGSPALVKLAEEGRTHHGKVMVTFVAVGNSKTAEQTTDGAPGGSLAEDSNIPEVSNDNVIPIGVKAVETEEASEDIKVPEVSPDVQPTVDAGISNEPSADGVKCPLCDVVARSNAGLSAHMRKKHPIVPNEAIEETSE